jgi:superfamily II DNA helicase RecQ
MFKIDSAIEAGIKAVYINEDLIKANRNIWKEVENGPYRLVYVCLESWLTEGSYFWQHLSRRQNKFMSGLVSVAIDEVHCAWSCHGFQVEYRAIGRMHDCMPDVPFMGLSATLPPNIRSFVSKSLRLENALHIIESVCRRNIKIIVSKITSLSDYSPLKILIPEDTGPPNLSQS